MTDNDYISQVLELAKQSSEPVRCPCIIVQNGQVIAREYNSQRADNVAIHHAEMKAVYQANRKTSQRKLTGAVAYCSCEPCAMCLAALSYANVERIVYVQPMAEVFPDDPQAKFDSQNFVKQLNFVPRLEQVLV